MHAFNTRQRVVGLQPSHVQQPPPYASLTPPITASQSLPDYSPYYTSSHSTGLATLHIELDQSSTRVYDIEDLVTGHIVFTPKRNSVVTHAYATLSGEECTSHSKRRLNLGKFIVPIQDSRGMASGDGTAGILVKKGITYRFRFSIQIPMTVHSIDNESDDDKSASMSALLLIPPSLGPTPDLGIETTHSVSYFVSACVQEEAVPTNRTHLCELPTFVTLCPSYPPELSANSGSGNFSMKTGRFAKKVCGSWDPQFMETTTVAVARRTSLFKRANPHGTVQIRVAAAPVYVDLDKSTGDVAGTVPLQLAYTAHDAASPQSSPPEVAQVSVVLNAITTDTHGITTSELLPLIEHPVLRPRWCPRTQTTELAVPVSVPIHTNALPTFATALLTRRYEMQVTVHFKGATGAGVLDHLPVVLVASAVPRHYFEYLEAWQRVAAQQCVIDQASRRQSRAKAALIELESHETNIADGTLIDCCQ